MRTKNKVLKIISLIILVLLIVAGILLWPKIERQIQLWIADQQQSTPLPPEQNFNPDEEEPVETPPAPNPSPTPPAPVTIPKELNYAVPFTSQAPFANWDERHEEYCEEASILMAARFFAKQPIASAADADRAMQKLDAWQVDNFGYFESTTANETAQMARANFPFLQVEVKTFSLTNMKTELAKGNLVVLPALGRELGNPNFTPPGPVYHMFVVKGYLADGRIITNDPGTRKGADYIYDANVLASAVADYDHSTKAPDRTKKVMLVISNK